MAPTANQQLSHAVEIFFGHRGEFLDFTTAKAKLDKIVYANVDGITLDRKSVG